MKNFILTVIFMMSLVSCSTPSTTNQAQFPNPSSIYPAALNGDLREVLTSFSNTPDSTLTPEQLLLKKKYVSRFVKEDEPEDSNLKGLASEVTFAHQDYWRKSLRKELSEKDGLKYWFEKLKSIAEKRGRKVGPFSEDEAEKLVDYLENELKAQGYYSLTGRTKPYMDLMLWKKENLVRYPVHLGDDSVTVPVVMMDDFAVYGWLGYATFNDKKTGGWARKDKLFCVKPSYDVTSEQFHVSYLAHEGRHFADYKRFPKLESADLEYRAKLTELSLANETLKKLLNHFISEGANDQSSAHAYASFHVVKDLAQRLGTQLNASAVAGIDPTKIKKAAAELIVAHSNKLKSLGAMNTRGVFSSKAGAVD